MKIVLILILFCTGLNNAQSLKFGFDLEPQQVRISNQLDENKILGGNGLPIAIHFVAAYSPYKNVVLQAKLGRTFHFEFFGWEFGINGKYKIYQPFYIAGGILQHSNEGGMIQSNTYDTDYASILMLHVGAGVDITTVMSIEFNYYIPTSKKVIGGGYNSGLSQFNSKTFEYMFRLSLIWGWEI